MLFRIVVAFAFFVFPLRGQEEKRNLTEVSYICEQRNGLTNEQVQALNASKPIVTDDYNVKCYLRCLLRELNLVGNVGLNIFLKLAVLHENKRNLLVRQFCRQADYSFSNPKSSHMNAEGDLIMDGMANIKPEFTKYVVACLNTTGIEPCDKALNFENCVWTKKSEEGVGGN